MMNSGCKFRRKKTVCFARPGVTSGFASVSIHKASHVVGTGECLQAPDTRMRSSGGRPCQGCHRGCHGYHWCYQHHRCDHQVVLCREFSLLFGPQHDKHLENMILMDLSLPSLGLSPRLLLSAQNTLYFPGNTQHENFRG